MYHIVNHVKARKPETLNCAPGPKSSAMYGTNSIASAEPRYLNMGNQNAKGDERGKGIQEILL